MVNVVRGFKDTRAESLGRAVAGYLNRVQENRLDKLQQELMDEISGAKDAESAAAIMADPVYQRISTDTERFSVVSNFLRTAQPGQTSLQGYNEDGEMVLFSVRKGTPIDSGLFASRGLHAERERAFYLSGDKDEEIPELIGNFRSRGEAERSLAEQGIDISDVNTRILDQAQAGFEAKFATTRADQRRAEVDLLLRQDRFNLDKTRGVTVFSNLISEYRQGILTKSQFDEAWERQTAIYGRTPTDRAAKSLPDLLQQAAMVENASRLAKTLVDKAIADPRLLTRAAGLASFGSDVVAEVEAFITLAGGRPDQHIDDFDWGSLTGERAEFKGLLFDMAIISAAARGISGKSFSDKDLELFLARVGSDLHNVVAFAQNMRGLTNSLQNDFNTLYIGLQGVSYSQGFTKILLDQEKVDEAAKEFYKELGFDIPVVPNQ